MALGAKLKKMREAAGLSQKDVSNKLKWKTSQFVSSFEQDKSFPSIVSLPILAKLYNVDEYEFKKMVFNAMVEKYKDELIEKMDL